MAVIELETRTTSAQGNVTLVQVTTAQSALLIGAGDERIADELVISDGDLVQALLAATEPLAENHFVD
jgi:hypothetical protein